MTLQIAAQRDLMPQREFPGKTQQLRRSLGLSGTLALGVSSSLGGAIFALVGTAVSDAGPGVLFSFVLALIATLFVAFPYTELACCYPIAGGIYTFVRRTLGDRWGVVAGWISVTSYVGVAAYIGIGFGNYFHALIDIPPMVGGLLLFVAVTLFNLCGGCLVDRLLKIIVPLTLVSLLGVSLGGLFHLHLNYFFPLLPHGLHGVMDAAPIAFLGLSGFDVIAAAGEEVDRPQRTLPLAIFATVGIIFGLYVLVCVMLVGLFSASTLATSHAPLADAAILVFGEPGRVVMTGVALVASAARANAILIASSRATFAMARDGLWPRPLARLSLRGVPYLAILINGLLFLLIVPIASVSWAAVLANTLYSLQFLFAFAALLIVRRKSRNSPVFRTPALFVILPAAVVSCLAMLLAGGVAAIGITCFVLSCGWLLAVFMRPLTKDILMENRFFSS